MERRNVEVSVRKFVMSLAGVIYNVLLIFVVAGILGVGTSSIVAMVGSAGLAIGLALQGSLANLAGGVLILLLKPFQVGDYIITPQSEGTVQSIDIFYTRLTTTDNRVIVIPNGTISNSDITNTTKQDRRLLVLEFSVSYDADVALIRDILLKEMKHRSDILVKEPMRVVVTRLSPVKLRMNAKCWVSPDEKVRKFTNPEHVALGCDAFWNTFWNLNQFWNLVTPEWSSKWVNSQLALYDANGWLAKGPAGMEYIPVMVAEHEIPQMVSTYQMGIRDYDVEKAFEAMKKMQTTPATHVAGGFAGNRDLVSYMKYKYVPIELGRFSNTLEYSYDDWTVGQMAKALGKFSEYATFNDRGYWWKNAINPENGYAHMRDSAGNFIPDFDAFQTGRNHHYVEGNSWQLSYFVPQDVPALIDIMGEKSFVDRLNWGFEVSEPWRYNAPNDQYWDYPVVQGNQQSMHFAFLFNWANKPWLTQKWSRSIIDRYYGCGVANAYLGDEDQGQMSAWFVMAALGLFQTDGGCSVEPIYEIASPLYEKVVIDLGKRYNRGETCTIEAKNGSRKNKYVQSATLNGEKLERFYFPAAELLKGGELILEMGDKPNKSWGIAPCSENK